MDSLNRFIIDNHCLEDRIEKKFFNNKDKAYVHMINVLYKELQEIKEMVKE